MEISRAFCKYSFCFWVISCDKWYQVISSWLHTSHSKMLSHISGSRWSVSWLVLLLRQSNMPCETREQLQGLLLCPEVTVQRWHLICTRSSFPHASSPAMCFICAKVQTTALFFHQTFHKFLFMLILILYSVKQTSSAVNIAQGPSEVLL